MTALLLPQHQALIEASAITPEVAQARGYRSITSRDELQRLGFPASQQLVPALLNPVWSIQGAIGTYQIRPDTPRLRAGKPVKYETVAHSRMVLDVPPATRPHLGNPSVPLWITEGIRKADSGVSHGLAMVALLGVWNWRHTNKHGGKTALPEWEDIALNGREVFIVFDSDVMDKPEVADALARFGAFLGSRRARVRYVYLPNGRGGAKVGLDDYLAAGGSLDRLRAGATTTPRAVERSKWGSVPPYPVHVWPDTLAQYLTQGAAAIDTPVDMAAVPLLSILGGVVGNRRSLALKQNYVVRPAIWTAVLADTTTGKTPSLGLAMALVEDLQATAVDRFDLETAEYEAAQGAGKGTHSTPRTRPVLEHFFTNSCTMEWVAPAARDSAGIAVVRDELLGWFRDLDAYRQGKGGDRQTWLSLWSGGSLKVDRKGSGSIYVRYPVVGLCGGIQPGRFPELARDAAADAFLARFLLSAPDTHVPGWSEATVEPLVLQDAQNLVVGLRMETPRDPLPLSNEARQAFVEWHEDNNAQIEDAPPLMRDVYGKLPAQLGKIALILHCCHDPEAKEPSLPVERMQGAIDLIEYHRAHAQRAYAMLGVDVASRTDPRERRVLRILRKPEAHISDRWVNRTTILDGLRNVPTDDLTDVLETLESAGTIEHRTAPGVTKSTEQWRLIEPSTPFGASGYSDYSAPEGEYPEYSEAPNGYNPDVSVPDRDEALV